MSDYYLNHKARAIEYWRDMNKALAENEKLRAERDALKAELEAERKMTADIDRLTGELTAERDHARSENATLRAWNQACVQPGEEEDLPQNETLRAEVIRLTYEKEQLIRAATEIAEHNWSSGPGFELPSDVLAVELAAIVQLRAVLK